MDSTLAVARRHAGLLLLALAAWWAVQGLGLWHRSVHAIAPEIIASATGSGQGSAAGSGSSPHGHLPGSEGCRLLDALSCALALPPSLSLSAEFAPRAQAPLPPPVTATPQRRWLSFAQRGPPPAV